MEGRNLWSNLGVVGDLLGDWRLPYAWNSFSFFPFSPETLLAPKTDPCLPEGGALLDFQNCSVGRLMRPDNSRNRLKFYYKGTINVLLTAI